MSLPSWDLFESQSEDYKNKVLPPDVPARVAVEAASPFGWERYVGQSGQIIGMKSFGASAPINDLFEHFGLTPAKIVQAAKDQIKKCQKL